MADLSFIVGLVGNVISILVFASPIGTFRRVVKKKSTESFKWQPYVTTLMSTSMWTYYGLLKTNGLLVVTVNGAGTVLQAIYVILYLIYTSKDTRVHLYGKNGWIIKCWSHWCGDFGDSFSSPWKLEAFGDGIFVCSPNNRNVCITIICNENGDEDTECRIHAFLPFLLPLPQCRDLDHLRCACQRHFHTDPKCYWICFGFSSASNLFYLQEESS